MQYPYNRSKGNASTDPNSDPVKIEGKKKKTSNKEMPQEDQNHFKSPPFHTQIPKKIRSLQRKTPISKRKGTGKRRLKGEKKILLTLKQKQGSKASERQ